MTAATRVGRAGAIMAACPAAVADEAAAGATVGVKGAEERTAEVVAAGGMAAEGTAEAAAGGTAETVAALVETAAAAAEGGASYCQRSPRKRLGRSRQGRTRPWCRVRLSLRSHSASP